MRKLVVLGSGGRLGAALARYCAADAEVIGFDHGALDLASPEALERALEEIDFDALVNCAALTQVDYCEKHAPEAYAVNARAVGVMGRICERRKARCIHISTDYVFDGAKGSPYVEADEACPISVYGESKRRGEIELLDASSAHLAARVSWVFGPDRPSFVDQVIRQARESDQVQAIGDKWSTPTFTGDLARWLHSLLWDHPVGGLIHLAQSGACTWQEYGQYALDCAAEAGIPLRARSVNFQALADLKAFVARRPVYTVLDTGRFARLTGVEPRPWREAVRDYICQHYGAR